MSNTASLQATERDTTLNPRQLRSAGFIPATLYGKGVDSISVQVREIEFVKLYNQGNKEFELAGLPGSPNVKVQNVQVTAITEEILSIEFLHLNPPASPAKPAKASKANKEAALVS